MKHNTTLLLYVPVVHAGYLKFIRENSKSDDVIYILDSDVLRKNFSGLKKLIRDVRAIDCSLVVYTLQKEFPDRIITALSGELWISLMLQQIMEQSETIIMHDDDVSETIIKGLPEFKDKIILKHAHLRWDSKAATMERKIDVPIISSKKLPQNVILELQNQIGKSFDWWRQVACVAFKGNEILLAAYNQHYPNNLVLNVMGDPRFNFKPGEAIDVSTAGHAERTIMGICAGRNDIGLKGYDILVSDFPCPPCAYELIHTGIQTLYFVRGYSLVDSQEILECAGIKIIQVKIEL